MVKYKITKEEFEALSETMQTEYNLKDGSYVLDLTGVDLSGSNKYEAERGKRRAAEEQQKKLQAELDDLKENDDRQTLIDRHSRETAKLAKERDAANTRYDGIVRRTTLDSEAMTIAEKLSKTNAKVLLPHVAKRLALDMTDPDAPKVLVLGADGKPNGKTSDDVYKEMLADKDFAGIVQATPASGGLASRPGAQPTRGFQGAAGAPPQQQGNGQAPDLSRMDARSIRASIDARGGPVARTAGSDAAT